MAILVIQEAYVKQLLGQAEDARNLYEHALRAK